MLLQVPAEVQQRFGQQAAVFEQRRDQQAPDASIAIEERVDGFKLGVRQRNPHQRRERARLVVNELLKIAQQAGYPIRRRRHKSGVARTGATDPVLRTPQFPGLLASSAHAIQ